MVFVSFQLTSYFFKNPKSRNDASFYRIFSGLPCFEDRMDSHFNANILRNLSFKNGSFSCGMEIQLSYTSGFV